MRWYHVAALGVAVLVCAIAVGFWTSQSSDREAAITERGAPRAALAAQELDTTTARARLAREREETKTTLANIDLVTTSFHELIDVTGQQVDALAALNQLASTSPDAVDEINAKLAVAADLSEQMQTKAVEIVDQIEDLEHRADSQYATFSSGEEGEERRV